MKAALLHAYAAAPVLGDHPRPEIDAGRSVIRVHAAPIVPLDLLCASGTSYFGAPPLPYVPGVQGVGVVESSSELAVGTRVWFATSAGMAPGDGSLAEWCAARGSDVVPIGDEVPDAVVAALGTSGIAAWMSLSWRAGLQAGERVVVLGASGAVGQVARAVARHLGAGRVVAVCRSEAAGARVQNADAVVVPGADEDRSALAARLQEAAGGPVDVVIDPVFGEPAAAAALALGPGGRLVNLGGAAGDVADFSSSVLRGRSIDIRGYTNNAISTEQRADALTQVLALAARGEVSIDHRILPLTECAEAWEAARGSGPRIVVSTS